MLTPIEGAHHADVVEPGVLPGRRNQSEDDPEETADQHGGHGQFNGRGEPLLDLRGDLLPGPDRLPQVELDDPLEKQAVLDVERLLEAEIIPHGVERLLRRPLAEEQFRRIAGGDRQHQEDDDGHPEEGRDDRQDPPNDETGHIIPA